MTTYLDIETTTFFQDPEIKALPRAEQLAAMRFGCAVTATIDSVINDHDPSWQEWQEGEIAGLYEYLVTAKRLVVGWNIIDFDWPVIMENARRSGVTVLEIETEFVEFLDLFAEIRRTTGRWYKLEDIAQANLGRSKLADGQKAAEWLRSGDPELVRKAMEYCRHDVLLTVGLHSILLRGDPLILPPRPARQELNEIHWWLDRQERIPDASGAVSMR